MTGTPIRFLYICLTLIFHRSPPTFPASSLPNMKSAGSPARRRNGFIAELLAIVPFKFILIATAVQLPVQPLLQTSYPFTFLFAFRSNPTLSLFFLVYTLNDKHSQTSIRTKRERSTSAVFLPKSSFGLIRPHTEELAVLYNNLAIPSYKSQGGSMIFRQERKKLRAMNRRQSEDFERG